MRKKINTKRCLSCALVALFAFLFVSCKETSLTSKISVKFERTEEKLVKNYSRFDMSRGISVPTTVSDFNCIFINVMGRGIGEWETYESTVSAGPYSYFSKFTKMITPSAGGILSLGVPSGKGRIIQIIGVVTSLPCTTEATAEGLLDTTHYPALFEISRNVTDLSSDTNIEMSVSYKPASAVDVRFTIVEEAPTLVSLTPDSATVSSIPTSVVATFSKTMASTAATNFALGGNCTTNPTVSVAVSDSVITATLSGGSCSNAQILTVTVDPTNFRSLRGKAGSGSSVTKTYTTNLAPVVTSVTPSGGALAGGTVIAIAGTGISSTSIVTVGGVACTFLSFSTANGARFTCTTGGHAAGTVDVVVTNTDGQTGTGSGAFTYRAAPTVTGVTYPAGATGGGTNVTVTGTGFVSGARVYFDTGECTSPNVVSATSTTCTTPAHAAGAVTVTVINSDGQYGILASAYTYQAAPTVSSASPNGGLPAGGTNITVTGTGFVTGITATVGGVACTSPTWTSATTMTCTTPAGSGVSDIIVTNTDNQTNASGNCLFTYRAAPTVSSVSPNGGLPAGGTNITITGTGFVTGITATVGGVACTSPTWTSATTMTCTTGNYGSQATVNAVVTNTDTQTGTGTNKFTYRDAPTITSISPISGLITGGTNVTIMGTGFVTGITATVGGLECTSPSFSDVNHMTCITGTHSAGAVNISVTNTDTQTVSTNNTPYIYITGESWSVTTTNNAPSGRISHTAVWTGSQMITFGGYDGSNYLNTGGQYDPVATSWSITETNGAPSIRKLHTAVWTGSKMIIWGGLTSTGYGDNTGGLYDPVADQWTVTSSTNVPQRRKFQTGVWTDTKMLVWSGSNSGTYINDGGQYDPTTNNWSLISTSNAPAVRSYAKSVWTGNKMIVFGGSDSTDDINTGGIYDPNLNSWTAMATTTAPTDTYFNTAVWSGSKMIIFGGSDQQSTSSINTGGQYDPNLNTWTLLTTTGAPSIRNSHTAEWTGSKMLVFAGTDASSVNTGGLYDPFANSWTSMIIPGAPSDRFGQTAVWTGNKMIVFGGYDTGNLNTGGVYTPPVSTATNTWTVMTTTGAPSSRKDSVSVWTGSKMIVWGGLQSSTKLNSGGQYDPVANSWSTTATPALAGTSSATAIWTGSEMIVWGGSSLSNEGSRYDPTGDIWAPTYSNSAPSARQEHTAVWTGSSMIIFGGNNNASANYNNGGMYFPATNSWTATPSTTAPSQRTGHTAIWTGGKMLAWGSSSSNTGGIFDPNNGGSPWTAMSIPGAPTARTGYAAIWTGSKMIVWGGDSASNTGGIFVPNNGAGSWTITNTTGAPTGRNRPSVVWTGSRMIVFGGDSGSTYFNSGGQYDPATNSWVAITTTSAPSGRTYFPSVWTGSQMLIWGGSDGSDTNTGGLYTP